MNAAKIRMPRTVRETILILWGFFLILAVSEPDPFDTRLGFSSCGHAEEKDQGKQEQ